MSCNCNNIDPCSNTNITCLCGVEFNIYDPSGVLIETVNAYQEVSEIGSPYIINDSTAFESVLGQSYVLTIQYNDVLDRWEMSYFNDTIDEDVVIGVFYGSADSCPASNCWDMDCIAVAFNVLGTYDSFFIWDGTYVNGKKSYAFVSDWSGSDISYSLSWGLAPVSAGAPLGTNCWSLYDEDSDSYVGYLFGLNNCPYGVYLTGWSQAPSRFSFTDLGVTGYDVKSSILDCGCCDESILINLTYNDILYTDIVATVVRDEYGNVIAINNYQYYTFELDSEILYLYYTGSSWMFSDSLTIGGNIYAELLLTNNCPFGSYLVNDNILCNQCLTINFTYNETEYTVNASFYGTEEGVNIYFYTGLDIDVALIYDQSMQEGAIYVFVDGMEFNVDFVSNVENAPCPFSGTWTPETEITNISVEQCGNAGLNITSFRVRGSECFDCCDYYRPGNRNLLKKKKAIFVDEISSIRNKEIFGFKCGTSWDDLFRKHLIFDVLNCLPYGVICDEEEQCLINNLNENCNC